MAEYIKLASTLASGRTPCPKLKRSSDVSSTAGSRRVEDLGQTVSRLEGLAAQKKGIQILHPEKSKSSSS